MKILIQEEKNLKCECGCVDFKIINLESKLTIVCSQCEKIVDNNMLEVKER